MYIHIFCIYIYIYIGIRIPRTVLALKGACFTSRSLPWIPRLQVAAYIPELPWIQRLLAAAHVRVYIYIYIYIIYNMYICIYVYIFRFTQVCSYIDIHTHVSGYEHRTSCPITNSQNKTVHLPRS